MDINNITKNLLLGLTLVCVVVVIVFCIQLIALNTGDRADGDGAVLSGDRGQTATSNVDDNDEDVDNETNGEDADAEPDGGISQPWEAPSLPHQGARHEIRPTHDTLLAIYVNEQVFSFAENVMNWAFEYTGGGSASLTIELVVVTLQGIAVDAVAYLNEHMGGFGAEFVGGAGSIRGSQVTGYHATGQNQGQVYEAWFHTFAHTDLALAFFISYENDTQRDELYRMLGSMQLMGSGVEVPSEHADIHDDEDEYYYDPDEVEG